MTTLRLGSKGPDVIRLQTALTALGFHVDADGSFGKQTARLVAAFQSHHGLIVDCICGPATWARLLALVPAEMPADALVRIGDLTLPITRCWPLRALPDGRKPQVTSRHAIHNASRSTHYGVDLFYQWRVSDPFLGIGDGGRTPKWWIPDRTLAVSPAAGVVEIAGNSKTGWRCWIAHDGGVRTGGFHMSSIHRAVGDVVAMGDTIGIVGDNPSGHDARHLHWECYRGQVKAYPSGTVDPELWLSGARVMT